jgi:hypothetical protein
MDRNLIEFNGEEANFPLAYFNYIHREINKESYAENKNIIVPRKINVEEFTQDLANQTLSYIKDKNFIVLENINQNDFTFLQDWIKDYMGNIEEYSGKTTAEVSYIEYVQGGKHYVDSCHTQPLHIDGIWLKTPPKYLMTYCFNQAKQGGETVLVEVDDLYSSLLDKYGDDVELLFEDEATYITTNYNSFYQSVLFHEENGKIGIYYAGMTKGLKCKKDVAEMYHYICDFVHNPTNQKHYIIRDKEACIFSNSRLLHSRLRFASNSKRKLARIWFNPIKNHFDI